MNATYHVRAERRDGSFFDALATGATLGRARSNFQEEHSGLAPFDWRGLVVFCEGAAPCEAQYAASRDLVRRHRLLRAS